MGKQTFGLRAAWMLAGLMLVATPAWAQSGLNPGGANPLPQPQRPGRPFRPLFGPEGEPRPMVHSIDFSLVAQGAFDNVPLTSDSATPAAAGSDYQQAYSAAASLSYARRGETLQLGAGGSATVPYYPDMPDVPVEGAYSARASVGLTGRHASFAASADYAHLPYFVLVLDPFTGAAPIGGALDLVTSRNPVNRLAAGASVRQEFGRRTSGGVSYSRSGGILFEDDRNSKADSVAASLEREWSRTVKMTTGYVFTRSEYESPSASTLLKEHGADIGLNYSPRSRRDTRTVLSASAGVSRVDDGVRVDVRPRWAVRAQRSIAGTWGASASYERRLQTLDVLSAPIWGDAASVSVGGALGTRVSMGFGGNYSDGEASGGEPIRMLTATAGMRVALTANIGINLGYVYMNYRFPEGYDLPTGMPRTLERNRAQVGVSFWVPVARWGRMPARGANANQ